MARLLFGGDDVSMRGPYGAAQLNASGRTGLVTTDAAGLVPADIVTYPGGAAIAGSVVTVTADSQLPLFQGPADGTDTLYVSVDGHAPSPIYTNVDARLDLLNTTVGTKAAITYVDAQDAAEAVARAAADGTRLNWRGAWAATTAYVTNDLVSFNGGLYRAPSNFTSGGSFVLANWVELVAQSGTYASAPTVTRLAPPRPVRVKSDTTELVNTSSSSPTAVRFTDSTRQRLIIVNLSTSQTLSVGYGTIGSLSHVSEGDSVLPGQQWECGADQRPVFARFPTTAESVRVYVEIGG